MYEYDEINISKIYLNIVFRFSIIISYLANNCFTFLM